MDPTTTAAAGDSLSQIITGGGLVLSGGLILKLLEMAQKVWVGRHQKNEIGPQPFEVRAAESFVRCSDCIEHRRILENQHKDLAELVHTDRQNLTAQLSAIRTDLSENDRRAEERSRNLHKRLDPVVEGVGILKGRVEDHINASTKSTR